MKETVEQVKADLEARSVDLSGPCGAFQITRRVAWRLKDQGAGLLWKPSGNNCEGYATDVICYPDGRTFDILQDGGGANGPQWDQHLPHDPAIAERYRPAIDPGDGPSPEPEPEPQPDLPDLAAVIAQLQHMAQRVDEIRNEFVLTRAAIKAVYDKPAPVYRNRFIGAVTPEGQ